MMFQESDLKMCKYKYSKTKRLKTIYQANTKNDAVDILILDTQI